MDFYKLWLILKKKIVARSSLDYIFKFGREMGVNGRAITNQAHLDQFAPISRPFYAVIWKCNPKYS